MKPSHDKKSRLGASLMKSFARQMQGRDAWSPCVQINKNASGDPLFLIPGGGGNVVRFRHLVEHLKDDRPIVCLVPKGWDGKQKPYQEFEELINDYLDFILKTYPDGTCHFAGWCFGGLVGYELACRLTSMGHPVGTVSVLETWCPEPYHITDGVLGNSSYAKSAKYTKLINAIATCLKSPRQGTKKVEAAWRLLKKRLFVEKCRIYSLLGRELPIPMREKYIQYYELIMEKKYRAPQSTGDVLLFWSEEDPDWEWLPKRQDGHRVFDPYRAKLGWEALTSGIVSLCEVPGDHETMFEEPQVERLGNKMNTYLNL